MVLNEYFVFLLGVSSPCFQNNFSAKFACEICDDIWGGLSCGFSVHFAAYLIMWWVLVRCEKWICIKEKLVTLLSICKPWFEMTFDSCMIMYTIYIRYSVLWVFALFVGHFNCLIHILNVNLKIWADEPTKSNFTFVFKYFKNMNCF